MLLVWKLVQKVKYRGVANVGVKPTFHDPAKAEVVIEVNILILMKIFMANELLCIGTIS